MNYISVKQASELWNISERRIRMLCSQGRVPGAVRLGNYMWNIPEGSSKPSDFRTMRYLHNKNLRAGANDYSSANFLNEQKLPNKDEKIGIIRNILRYQNIFLSNEQINHVVFFLSNVPEENISLELSVKILDLYGSLSALPIYINMKNIIELNKMVCRNIYSEDDYLIESDYLSKIDMLIQTYNSDWSVLHPVARATFIFDNILKNQPFKFNNIETAFIALENELILNKLNCAVLPDNSIDELKGDLVSSAFKGNLQKVISLILNAISK